jgi:RHS repeat-associated protein
VTLDDVRLVQAESGVAVDSTTFQYDTNVDGFINSADIGQTKAGASNANSVYPDFAFTGHYYHARSGLYLAPYRPFSPTIGRWLSRDPIGENGGLNLYQYVRNSPVKLIDPFGKQAEVIAGGFIIEEIITGGAVTGFVLELIKDSCKKCPPCMPFPKGTIGYQSDSGHTHYPASDPHLHLWQVNQRPSDCKCFWNEIGAADPPPQAGWVSLGARGDPKPVLSP